jgi:hypothetical protein
MNNAIPSIFREYCETCQTDPGIRDRWLDVDHRYTMARRLLPDGDPLTITVGHEAQTLCELYAARWNCPQAHPREEL